ncbi:MAG: carboxypeptidase-like regulatory domain-containing protein, partial [Bacteroidetes bacterium]|nr:carboxypeptidase-like regulatory domain-containing protein [Bacteroidota bacterium]
MAFGTSGSSLRLFAGGHAPLLSRWTFLTMVVGFLCTAQSLMATGTIKGKVLDQLTKETLTGASVLVKGTSIGASTDLNGAFTIYNAPSGTQTLVVSYVGYTSASETVEVP